MSLKFTEQLALARAAGSVLTESRNRVGAALQSSAGGAPLSVEQRESCEALIEAHRRAPELLETVERLETYARSKGYIA